MRFKERYMFHKDVKEVDKWMVFLSQHCHYFQAEEILQLGKKLGDGAFGAVYEAKHSYSDQICAVKKIDKSMLVKKTLQYQRNELQIVSMIRHPYITEIRDVYEE